MLFIIISYILYIATKELLFSELCKKQHLTIHNQGLPIRVRQPLIVIAPLLLRSPHKPQ